MFLTDVKFSISGEIFQVFSLLFLRYLSPGLPGSPAGRRAAMPAQTGHTTQTFPSICHFIYFYGLKLKEKTYLCPIFYRRVPNRTRLKDTACWKKRPGQGV